MPADTDTVGDEGQELVLPAKTIDPDDDLTDRLTDNVLDEIGPARYFRTEEGEPVEDWNDVFDRVAKNIAIAEAVYHDTRVDVTQDILADWVDQETADELFFKPKMPSWTDPDPETKREFRELDEELAPYVDYDRLRERVPEEIATEMADTRERFEQAMREQRFIPNTPTLINAGTELQQLSACFVRNPGDSLVDVPDSMRESIMDTAKESAAILQTGGGIGYAFHLLRPKGARINSTDGVSSGPVSFMPIFDAVCGSIQQGGVRRGAQMGIMHSQHPDVGRFCVAKRGEEEFTNFNISVGITDEFLEAVEADEEYTLVDPRTGWPDPDPFEVVPESRHFYDPAYADAWNEAKNKPAEDENGNVVEANFWRDHLEEMGDPEAFEAYRDRIDLDAGEPMTLPAGFIWQLIVDGAHHNGEPGFVYLDEINREHSFDVEAHPEHVIHGTNPCVTGDTLISTARGLRRADELANELTDQEDIVVDSRLSDDTVKTASPVYKTGEKDVYALTTEEGYELRLTADHRVMTDDGWVEAGELESGDTVHIQDHKGEFGDGGSAELGRVLGWLVGDGHLKHGEGRAVLNFYDDDTTLSKSFADDVNAVIREPEGNGDYEVGVLDVARADDYRGPDAAEQRVGSTRLYEIADEAGLTHRKTQVPDDVMHGSEEMAREFLRALFTADGSVQGTIEKGVSVRLSTVDLELAKEVQRLLLNFGIGSRVYENRQPGGERELPDGQGGYSTYETQPRHEVVVSSSHLLAFEEEIGFLSDDKNEQLAARLDSYGRGPYRPSFTATVESVEYDGYETVYDLTEPETSSFIANGVVVHNCAEQPLENGEPCNLGHVNLSLLADEDAQPYHEWHEATDATGPSMGAYLREALDIEQLHETVETGTQFLDNVVTMSKFPLEEIEATAHAQRKIGLGVMGFHQLCLQLGIEYGSEASYDLARQVMSMIDAHATRTSHQLALERDVFPDWAESKWADVEDNMEWLRQHGHVEPYEFIEDGFAMRNHNVTTVAPTGTTSMIGNTTGGCEPLYNVAYYKNVSDDVQGEGMLLEIDDYFQRVLEANGVDVEAVREEIGQLMADNEFDSVDDLETVPDAIGDLFVTTEDLAVDQHINVQAAFQEAVDSSISKTLNLANDATREETSEAIQLALEKGIKGATVYRIASRTKEVKTTSTTGGAVPLTEADDDELVEEVTDRLDADEDDEMLRQHLMAELGLVDTTVDIVERDGDGGEE